MTAGRISRDDLLWFTTYVLLIAIAAAVLAALHSATLPQVLPTNLSMMFIFPAITLWLTRKDRLEGVPVHRPGLQLSAVIAFMIAYAWLFTGWGLSAFKALSLDPRSRFLWQIALKLAVHVLLPLLLIGVLGGPLRPLFRSGISRMTFWRSLLVLGIASLSLTLITEPAAKQLMRYPWTQLAWGLPLALLWLSIEAGLCEEVLFRAVLQTRLAAVMKSEAASICTASLLFGLVHAPGFYLRATGYPGLPGRNLAEVLAFCVAVVAPGGFFLGVLWSRTRSLLLVVLVHGALDLLALTPYLFSVWM